MSKYIPRSAVDREQGLQMLRRAYIEKRNEDALKGFQEELKTKQTVLEGLIALGLTRRHAIAVETRLIMLNELERRRREAKEASDKAKHGTPDLPEKENISKQV